MADYGRFWSKVSVREPADCWLWDGSVNNRGYGEYRHDGRKRYAHRVSWAIAHGAMPGAGLCVLHRCDVPRCVNPSHLFIGTQHENIADMHSKGRYRNGISRGEKANRSHLTNERVLQIISDTRPQRLVARLHGISQSTVSAIRRRKTWTHLEVACLTK